jgi:DNA-binding transcriptional regulator YiaG
MANVAKVLKNEIARISRKEIKNAVGDIGKTQTNLRKIIADLKKRIASLEKEIKRLTAEASKQKAPPLEKLPEQQEKARLTAKTIRSLRKRLGLSQAEFATLAGVAEQSVYLWEKKEGPLKLRDKTRAAFGSIKGMGARDAKAKLEEFGEPKRRRKAAS